MNNIFSNKCRYKVCVRIESGLTFEIQPYSTTSISCDENDKFVISVKRDITSYKRKNKYILVLETQYEFENVKKVFPQAILSTYVPNYVGVGERTSPVCEIIFQNGEIGQIEFEKKDGDYTVAKKQIINVNVDIEIIQLLY